MLIRIECYFTLFSHLEMKPLAHEVGLHQVDDVHRGELILRTSNHEQPCAVNSRKLRNTTTNNQRVYAACIFCGLGHTDGLTRLCRAQDCS